MRRAAVLACAAALAAVAPARAFVPRPLAPSPYRITDTADLGVRASWLAHGAAVGGGFAHRETASLGALLAPVAGAHLNPGGSVQAWLAIPPGDAAMLLTLATAPRDYGRRQVWRVLLDGVEAARGSDIDPGGGITRSYFVPMPPGRARRATVRVECDGGSEAPVTVAALRSVAGLAAGAPPDPRDPRTRMGLAMLTSRGIGYEIDRAEMERIRDLAPRSEYVTPQAAVAYNFAKRDAAANAAEIGRLADLAAQVGVPLRIAFQFHWAGIPGGVPDGAGGTFTDLPYQMITYDPDNRREAPGLSALMGDRYDRRYGLSVPNCWGSTPWLTFNHPRLNQLYRARIIQALAAWVDARARLDRLGRADLLPGQLSTGEETIYWARGVDDSAYTAANEGKPRADLSADYNPYTVADALRDRVVLDPRDGLSGRERWWLHQNLGRRQQRIVDWMLEGIPAEAIHLTPTGPDYAGDLVRRNVFTEPYAMPCFPMKGVSEWHPGLEAGYVRDGRSGGEYWSGATMIPWLLKERELGRIALPNLECTGADDAQLTACLRAAYACGARFATLYNWHYRTTIGPLLADFARSIARIPWLTFAAAASAPPTSAASAAAAAPTGTTPAPAPTHTGSAALTRTWASGPGAFGVNCVEVTATVALPSASLKVEVADESGARRMAIVCRVVAARAGDPIRVHLPAPFATQPGRRYTVSASVDAVPGALAAAEDGALAVRIAMDAVTERRRSLLIEDLRDAADIVQAVERAHAAGTATPFARDAAAEARALLTAGDPVAAYAAAVRAEQLSLPAAFDVPAPGSRLEPFRVAVTCPAGPVRAAIVALGPASVRVRLMSEVAQQVTVRWHEGRVQAALTPRVSAEIEVVRSAAPAPDARPRRHRRRRAATRPQSMRGVR